MKEDNSYQKLLEYSLKLLSRKSYTESEVRKKLDSFSKRRSLGSPEIEDQVIERLKELKYLDDKLFIKNYTNDRINFAPRSKSLIRMELIRRGVDRNMIDIEMNSIDFNEEKLAKDLARKYMKKFGQKVEGDKLKRRLFGFLSRKGFRPDAIYKAASDCYNSVS